MTKGGIHMFIGTRVIVLCAAALGLGILLASVFPSSFVVAVFGLALVVMAYFYFRGCR